MKKIAQIGSPSSPLFASLSERIKNNACLNQSKQVWSCLREHGWSGCFGGPSWSCCASWWSWMSLSFALLTPRANMSKHWNMWQQQKCLQRLKNKKQDAKVERVRWSHNLVLSKFNLKIIFVQCIIFSGWILMQKRGQYGNPPDYFSSKLWVDYEQGFGEPSQGNNLTVRLREAVKKIGIFNNRPPKLHIKFRNTNTPPPPFIMFRNYSLNKQVF